MISRCAALLVVIALVSGCNKQPKPTLMANMAKKEITVSQLRAIDYEYAARFGHAVATSAHEIVTETEDADVVEHALRWRMWAMPQARAAAFAQDRRPRPHRSLLRSFATVPCYRCLGRPPISLGDPQAERRSRRSP
jgi:hypothetical protein